MESDLDKTVEGEPAEYGLEVLCASWNPLAATLAEPLEVGRELVAELAAADAEGFLASFYRSQQG
jgi:hypothetical protein